MTIGEVESYYGKEAADWVCSLHKPFPFAVRLKNPNYERDYLKDNDVTGYIDYAGYPVVELPDTVRYSDIVRIEE